MKYQRHSPVCTTEFRRDQYGNWSYRFKDITDGNRTKVRLAPKDGLCPHCGIFAKIETRKNKPQETLF